MDRKTHIALILANVFFGSGAVIGALGLPATHPLVFALVGEVGAGLILLTISLYLHKGPQPNKTGQLAPADGEHKPALFPYALRAWTMHWKSFALLGLVVFGNQAGFIVGIKMAGPVTASVWQPSQPIFTAAICMALGWEPIQLKRLLGVFLASLGCVVMVLLKATTQGDHPSTEKGPVFLSPKAPSTEKEDAIIDSLAEPSGTAARYIIGNALFFGNCLCTSLYVILSKQMLAVYPAILVTAWSYNGAAMYMMAATFLASIIPGSDVFLCPECPTIESPFRKLVHVPSGAVPALLYYIVFASICSYGLITWANQHATGTLIMSYTVLQPVTSALLTALFLAIGVVANCQAQQSPQDTANSKCLDYPSFGTFCGIVGVFVGLALIISTEPGIRKSPTDGKNDRNLELEPLACSKGAE